MPIFQSPKVFLLSTFCGQTPMDSVYSQTQKEQQQQQQNHYHPQPQPQPQILNKQNPNKQKRLTQEQVRVLEKSFSDNKKLVPELKLELASQLGLPPRQVAVWYQNKRARWKAQSLELDHSTLQMKLDSTAAEKRRLQREVARLSNELTKAHEMVLALMMNSSSSTSCHVGSGPPLPSDFDPASRLMNIDAKNNNNNSCSSSSDHWGSSGLNFNNGDYEVLQVDDDDDEMDASFMMGGGGGTSASTCSWD